MIELGKKYAAQGDQIKRQSVFDSNLARIIKHNIEYELGHYSWWMSVNTLTDWTEEEFNQLRSARGISSARQIQGKVGLLSRNRTSNPDRVDWREKNVITPIKDQKSCGSCWAFSAVESLESHYAIAFGKLLELSPQALVNCVSNPQACGGDGGCKGATMELAFNFTGREGLPLNAIVPYVGRSGVCRPFTASVKSTGYVKLPPNDANELEIALATIGPVSVIVAALTWQFYGGGIYNGCSAPLPSIGNELDHAVQAVGYGSENGHRYWLVRNSWGSWGEQGYIRISRDSDAKTFVDDSPREGVACKPYPKTQIVGGECGILFDASYPTGFSSTPSSLLV